MKDVFLVYNTSCFYEIIILNYFMSVTGCDVEMCSLDGKSIRTMEGYSVNVDKALSEVDFNEVRSFTMPGGNINLLDKEVVKSTLKECRKRKILISAICAAVDLVDEAGLLKGIRSTHSTEEDVVNDDNIITSRANGYVDFAIEVAKQLNLFKDESDLQETIDFWKNYKRMQ